MRHGFQIGLECQPYCRSSVGNSVSASDLAPAVDAFLRKQCQAGLMLGPSSPEECRGVSPAVWVLFPRRLASSGLLICLRSEGHSVNDCVWRQYTIHLSYSSVDNATLVMNALGPRALSAKLDTRDLTDCFPSTLRCAPHIYGPLLLLYVVFSLTQLNVNTPGAFLTIRTWAILPGLPDVRAKR